MNFSNFFLLNRTKNQTSSNQRVQGISVQFVLNKYIYGSCTLCAYPADPLYYSY